MAAAARGFVNPWVQLVLCMLLMWMCTWTYSFPVYSAYLKDEMAWSQTTLQSVSTATRIGGLGGIVGGIVFDNKRYGGPKVTVFCGGLMQGLGMLILILGLRDALPFPTAHWHIVLSGVLFGTSCNWTDVAAVGTCIKNFPGESVMVSACLKSLMGLCTAISIQLYVGFFEPDVMSFLQNVGGAYPVAIMVIAPLLTCIEPGLAAHLGRADKGRSRRFKLALLIVAVSTAYLLTVGALQKTIPEMTDWDGPSSHTTSALTIVMLVILSGLLLVPVGSGPFYFRHSPRLAHMLMQEDELAVTQTNVDGQFRSPPNPSPDISFMQALQGAPFWILVYVAQFCAPAIYFMNIPQIFLSHGAEDVNQSTVFVSIFAIFSAIARTAMPLLSMRFPRWPVVNNVVVALVLNATATLMLAFAGVQWMYLASMMTGFSSGAWWSALAPLVAQVFGNRSFGTIFSFVSAIDCLGFALFPMFLFGSVYDSHTNAVNSNGEAMCDQGNVCYQKAMLIFSGLAWLGVFLCIWLARMIDPRRPRRPTSLASSGGGWTGRGSVERLAQRQADQRYSMSSSSTSERTFSHSTASASAADDRASLSQGM